MEIKKLISVQILTNRILKPRNGSINPQKGRHFARDYRFSQCKTLLFQ